MSKHQTAKRKKLIKTAGEPLVKKVQAPLEPKGLNSISNWLIVLILMMPITYSTDVLDTALVPRYIFLCWFLLLTTIYFFFLRNQNFNFSSDRLLKLVFGAAVAYGLWASVTLLFAINPAEGYYEVCRHFLNIILLFSITLAVREEGTAVLKLCKALTLMAIIQSFVGILQNYDLAFNYLPGNFKPYGLMANRNLFGSGQMYLLPFSIFLLHQGNRTWKYISVIAIAGLATSILLSQTRSAWLGTIVVFSVSLILMSIFSPGERKKWLMGSAISLLVIAVLLSLVLFTDREGTLTQSVKERAVSMTGPAESAMVGSASIKDRLAVWRQTTKMIQEYPVAGVGVGNWRIGVLKYGTEGTSWSNGLISPDRPHNVYLLAASETGLIGAFLYFGMWVLVAVVGFKGILRSQSDTQKVMLILMLAGLGAFAVDSMFSFPTERIEHTLYILVMAGIILGSYARKLVLREQQDRTKQKRLGMVMLAVIAVNLLMGFAKSSFEKHASLVFAYYKAARYQEIIVEAEAGKSSLVTLNLHGHALEFFSAEAYRMLKQYDKALVECNKAKAFHPYSGKVLITLGNIYTDMGQYEKALPVYEQAKSITPEDQAVLRNLAAVYFQVGNYKESMRNFEKLKREGDPYLEQLYSAVKYKLSETEQKPH